jgi:hypothetical protein
MAPNKQVSPAIRILRGERDASARATHLEAATRKFLVTTNERKYMSTKTNFKRIALVAVAALGLGVLSSVPSQAVVTGTVAVTITNGTATTALADSTTAGSVKVRWLATGTTDTVGITTSLNSQPTGGGSPTLTFFPTDTSTSVSPAVLTPASRSAQPGTSVADTGVVAAATSAGYVSGTFAVQLASTPTVAGTYTYTLTVTPSAAITGAETTKVVTADVSIVVTAPASASTTAASTYSSAVIGTGISLDSSTADATSAIALAGTAAATAKATVFVKLRNASGTATQNVKDSLTVTIDKGNVGSSDTAALGKSVIIDYNTSGTAGGVSVYLYPDGSTGKATVTIATKNAGTFTKTLTWYGTAYATITAAAARSVIAVGAEASLGAVSGTAADANKSSYGSATAVYAYSSDTTVISNYGTACTWNDILEASYCALTGVKAGTASITLRDAATVALSTVASSAVSVRVSTGVATSFTLKTDKATYAPGEKGYVMVQVRDAAGLAMPVQASTATLASGGITVSSQLGNSSDTLTATSFATEASSTPASLDPVKVYTFYAPVSGGAFTFSAKGASTFSAASQTTATTVSASVTDSGAAALAAVTALATTVASLKTLITTLTNLVLKIQKKVKA